MGILESGEWSDECNNRLIMDFSRNLIAFGPAAAIDNWETHRTHVIFAASSEHPVRIDECGNRLLLIGRYGKYAALEIPAGAAARARRAWCSAVAEPPGGADGRRAWSRGSTRRFSGAQ